MVRDRLDSVSLSDESMAQNNRSVEKRDIQESDYKIYNINERSSKTSTHYLLSIHPSKPLTSMIEHLLAETCIICQKQKQKHSSEKKRPYNYTIS